MQCVCRSLPYSSQTRKLTVSVLMLCHYEPYFSLNRKHEFICLSSQRFSSEDGLKSFVSKTRGGEKPEDVFSVSWYRCQKNQTHVLFEGRINHGVISGYQHVTVTTHFNFYTYSILYYLNNSRSRSRRWCQSAERS